MSTTITEQAEHAERRAKLLRLVAEEFPDARFEPLWDGGPHVPIVSDEKSRARADRVQFGVSDGAPMLFPYFVMSEEVADGGLAVFWEPIYRRTAYLVLVLQSIEKTAPDLYRRIVEEAKR